MLRSVKALQGYTVRATDGDVGELKDLYFDDRSWTIRYLVVETGNWLKGRKVLVPPIAIGAPKWEIQVLPVRFTKTQVRNSPPIDVDKPVSHQLEEELHTHYGWTFHQISTRALAATQVIKKATEPGTEDIDLALRSVKEVLGYDIQATDGQIGYVADFVIDDEARTIRYIVVDTRGWLDWLPGKQVLLSPSWIHTVSWPERNVYVDLSKETVKDSPEFDPSAPVNREYELRLYDYYGRPKYWTQVQEEQEVRP